MRSRNLRQDIIDELDFDPCIDATHIGVAVDDGIVTLTGHVSNYAEKLCAEQAVKRVKGVRAIAEEIEVRHPGDKKIDDEEIARRAADSLRWCSVVPRYGIQVGVTNGWVELSGEVELHHERKAAESAIHDLAGVRGITNNIVVSARAVTAADNIKRTIKDALWRSLMIEPEHVHVTVLENGKVFLDGKVRNLAERDAVERASWSVPGVTSVKDRISIV